MHASSALIWVCPFYQRRESHSIYCMPINYGDLMSGKSSLPRLSWRLLVLTLRIETVRVMLNIRAQTMRGDETQIKFTLWVSYISARYAPRRTKKSEMRLQKIAEAIKYVLLYGSWSKIHKRQESIAMSTSHFVCQYVYGGQKSATMYYWHLNAKLSTFICSVSWLVLKFVVVYVCARCTLLLTAAYNKS